MDDVVQITKSAAEQSARTSLVPCPVVILRVGGLPSDSLLSSGKTTGALTALRHLQGNRQGTRAACEALEALLPKVHSADRGAAGATLRVKRALHNGRCPREADVRMIRPFISVSCDDRINTELERHRSIIDAAASLAGLHATEAESEFSRAVGLLSDTELSRGLANTNPELARRVREAASGPDRMKAKVLASTRISALRQVGRVALKTSPLNVFGIVALGSWGDDGQPLDLPIHIDAPYIVRSVPSFANLDFLTATICAEPDVLMDTVPLRLNGSLRFEAGRFTWRKVESSPVEWRVRHTQVTRSDSQSAPLRVLARLVGDKTLARGELRSNVQSLLPHEDEARIESLLRSAVLSQFLVVDGLMAIDPRKAAQRIVEHVRPPLGDRLSQSLIDLDTNANDRRADLATATTLEMLGEVGIRAVATEIRPAIYEDAIVPGASFRVASDDLRDLSKDLIAAVRLASELQPNTFLERTRRFLVRAFKEHYGPAGSAADAFRFLSDCSDRMEDLISGGPDGPAEKLSDEAEVQRVVGQLLDQERDGQVLLTRESVLRLLKRPVPKSTSQMCFVQPYRTPAGARRFALNRCYAGGASTFSRFLHTSGQLLDGLQDYVRKLSEEGGPVEIVGWFGFNACDHPDLVKRKVAIPPLDSPADGLDDLRRYGLRHRPDWDDLVFTDPDGRDVSLTFTSVLAVSMMPRVHSFARMIGTHTESYAEAWRPFLKHGLRSPDGKLRLPRVDVGMLTIVRRQVLMAASHLPLEHDGLEFFIAFNDLMDAEEMPRFMYVCRVDTTPTPSAASRRWKPQFVDRHGPAFVAALRKDLSQHQSDVQFVEALPDPMDVSVWRGGRPVFAELGVEVAQCHN